MAIINNDKHSIGDLFNNRNPFIIPKHQRAYSWEEEEVDAFCNDLKDIESEYFFGGIVSVYEHARNTPGRIYRVVDGQQRLATFTIFLSLLKEAFLIVASKAESINDDTNLITAESLAEDLYDNYLTYVDTRQRPPVREYRLKLSRVDSDFFRELLNRQSPSLSRVISHQRLLYARDKINRNLILPIITDPRNSISVMLDQLQTLRDRVLEHSVVIHIVCDNLDEAYQLFEVLNDRGKELAIGDYLRSSTLEQLDNNISFQDRVAEWWDQILSKKDAEKYIKSYLTSHIAAIKNNNIHRQFQRTFFDSAGIGEQDIRDRVFNLFNLQDVYEAIINGRYPYENATAITWEKNRLSLVVKQLDHKLCVPFLLALYECGSEQEFITAVCLIEKFVFRYIISSGLRANRLSEIYKKHILYMRANGQINMDEFTSDLANVINTHCDDAVFAHGLEKNLVYKNNTTAIKKLRYFLLTVEDYCSWFLQNNRPDSPRPSTNLIYNIDSTEIEHIYPQNPSFVNVDLEDNKNTLGNLTFWSPSDNKIASNNSFLTKKQYYQASNVTITRLLADLGTWDKSTLENRKNFYLDIAMLIFKF